MIRVSTVVMLLLLVISYLHAQPNLNSIRTVYILEHKKFTLKEMKRTGIPASIIMAQGMLESACGRSSLAIEKNNHFNIECNYSWKGKRQIVGNELKCYKTYKNVYYSYKDHSDFLMSKKRYSHLFILKTTDYEAWAKGLEKAGYAINPDYAQNLIRIIVENKLYLLDKGIRRDYRKVGKQE